MSLNSRFRFLALRKIAENILTKEIEKQYDDDDFESNMSDALKGSEQSLKTSPHATVAGKPIDAPSSIPGNKPKSNIPGWNKSYELIDILPPLQGSAADRVAQAAKILCEHKEITGLHCWDWINKVYYYANCTVQRVYQDLDYEGPDCGIHKASQNLIDQIGPGDWLYVNNKNKLDTKGNHSVVVVNKTGPTSILAAACLKSGGPGIMYNIDLNKQPVVHISKPVSKN